MLPSILNSKLTALPKGTLYKSTVSAKFKFPAVSSRFYLYPPRSVFRATCRYDSRDDEDVFRGSKRFRGRNDAYGGSDKTERSGRSRAPFTVNITQKSLSELALPAAGLLAVGLVIGPLLGGLIATALGIGVAVAATTTALAFSWAFLPLLLGGGLLFGGALTAGLFATFAGSLLIFNMIKLGMLGVAVWLGTRFAQSYFEDGVVKDIRSTSGWRDNNPGIVDVEVTSIDDDISREKRQKESELQEFDDLIHRREAFKQGGRNQKS